MKAFKKQAIITLILYVIVYFIYTFVIWEFKNPLQWIIDIPTYTDDKRAMILFSYAIYHCMLFILIYERKTT